MLIFTVLYFTDNLYGGIKVDDKSRNYNVTSTETNNDMLFDIERAKVLIIVDIDIIEKTVVL